MSAFELSQSLENINLGCDRYDLVQMFPISGNVSSTPVGAGSASGNTTFQWTDNVQWWLPQNSYFHLQLRFLYNGAAIPKANLAAYADNFVMALFTQVQTTINSQSLDTVIFPHVVDTILTYGNAKKNFLDTWGSMCRVGEPFMTRVNNTCSNDGYVDVIFRPPASLYSAQVIPPGAQLQTIFTWANNGLAAFEAGNATPLTWGSSTYSISVSSFSFYKAVVSPAHGVSLPSRGVIELSPSTCVSYPLSAGRQLRVTAQLPGTVNKLTLALQDLNGTNAPGAGVYPATSFQPAVSSGGVAYTSFIQQLFIQLPELGVQMPNPVYNFSGIQDWIRAYADFCVTSQGSQYSNEGSVPFGDYAIDTTLSGNGNYGFNGQYFDAVTPALTQYVADPKNKNAVNIGTKSSAITLTDYSAHARWGWVGYVPGPMFQFPVVRPNNKLISTCNLNITMTADVNTCAFYLISSYSMALAVENKGNGQYVYNLVTGV